MTTQELKAQIDAILDAATIQPEELSPVEYFQKHFLTISEAILYADRQGVKLTSNPLQQFHGLCKSGKLDSVPVGEKKTRIIVKDSLDKWIATTKKKQEKA